MDVPSRPVHVLERRDFGVVRFLGPVNTESICGIIDGFEELIQRHYSEIVLEISSPGGDVVALRRFMEYRKRLSAANVRLITQGYDRVASAAATMLSSGDVRYVTENCFLLYHFARIARVDDLTASLAEQLKDTLDGIDGWQVETLVETTPVRGATDAAREEHRRELRKYLKEELRNEAPITPDQARERGLVDRIGDYISVPYAELAQVGTSAGGDGRVSTERPKTNPGAVRVSQFRRLIPPHGDIPVQHVLRHFLTFGETGSGKTKSFVEPMIEALLTLRPVGKGGNPTSMFVVDPKHELLEAIEERVGQGKGEASVVRLAVAPGTRKAVPDSQPIVVNFTPPLTVVEDQDHGFPTNAGDFEAYARWVVARAGTLSQEGQQFATGNTADLASEARRCVEALVELAIWFRAYPKNLEFALQKHEHLLLAPYLTGDFAAETLASFLYGGDAPGKESKDDAKARTEDWQPEDRARRVVAYVVHVLSAHPSSPYIRQRLETQEQARRKQARALQEQAGPSGSETESPADEVSYPEVDFQVEDDPDYYWLQEPDPLPWEDYLDDDALQADWERAHLDEYVNAQYGSRFESWVRNDELAVEAEFAEAQREISKRWGKDQFQGEWQHLAWASRVLAALDVEDALHRKLQSLEPGSEDPAGPIAQIVLAPEMEKIYSGSNEERWELFEPEQSADGEKVGNEPNWDASYRWKRTIRDDYVERASAWASKVAACWNGKKVHEKREYLANRMPTAALNSLDAYRDVVTSLCTSIGNALDLPEEGWKSLLEGTDGIQGILCDLIVWQAIARVSHVAEVPFIRHVPLSVHTLEGEAWRFAGFSYRRDSSIAAVEHLTGESGAGDVAPKTEPGSEAVTGILKSYCFGGMVIEANRTNLQKIKSDARRVAAKMAAVANVKSSSARLSPKSASLLNWAVGPTTNVFEMLKDQFASEMTLPREGERIPALLRAATLLRDLTFDTEEEDKARERLLDALALSARGGMSSIYKGDAVSGGFLQLVEPLADTITSKSIFFGLDYDERAQAGKAKKMQWLVEQPGQVWVFTPSGQVMTSSEETVVRACKIDLFTRVLDREERRNMLDRLKQDVPGNKVDRHLIAYVADEFQRFITMGEDGEQSFIDRCRSFGACCVFASQTIASLRYALGASGASADNALDIILANTGTKAFFRTTDRETIALVKALLGNRLSDGRNLPSLTAGSCWLLRPDGSAARAQVLLQ